MTIQELINEIDKTINDARVDAYTEKVECEARNRGKLEAYMNIKNVIIKKIQAEQEELEKKKAEKEKEDNKEKTKPAKK